MPVAITKITIVGSSAEGVASLAEDLQQEEKSQGRFTTALKTYLNALQAGVREGTVYLDVDSATDGAKASGTITIDPRTGDRREVAVKILRVDDTGGFAIAG